MRFFDGFWPKFGGKIGPETNFFRRTLKEGRKFFLGAPMGSTPRGVQLPPWGGFLKKMPWLPPPGPEGGAAQLHFLPVRTGATFNGSPGRTIFEP